MTTSTTNNKKIQTGRTVVFVPLGPYYNWDWLSFVWRIIPSSVFQSLWVKHRVHSSYPSSAYIKKKSGPKRGIYGRTPLLLACQNGQSEVVTQLLDKEGIDVNKEDIYVNCQISEKILGEDKKRKV